MADEERRLRRLWEQIPEVGCRGMCDEACGPIAMSQVEIEMLDRHALLPFPRLGETAIATASGDPPRCPLLDSNGRCTAYDDRPTICRLWGAEDTMKCEWGCVPKEGHLSHAEGRRILRESLDIGGGPAL